MANILLAEDKVHALRHALIVHGVRGCNADETRSIRELVWPQLLDIEADSALIEFHHYVKTSEPSQKILEAIDRDTRPTMKHIPELQARCSKEEFMQLLCAYDGWCKDKMARSNQYAHVQAVSGGYIQSMTRVSAALCVVLPRHLAWACLCKLLSDVMPGWFARSNSLGASLGCTLLDEVLQTVDPSLQKHIVSQLTTGYSLMSATPRVYTLFGQTTPITAVLPLYDALLCIGPHIVVPIIAAEIVLSREKLLASKSLSKALDNGKLADDASVLISTALHIFRGLPDDLQKRLQAWPLKTSSVKNGSNAPAGAAASAATASTGSSTAAAGVESAS